MKICFVSSMHRADDKRVHDKEARALVSAGFEVAHVCPGSDRGLHSFVVDGVQVRQYASRSGILGRLRQLRQLYGLSAQEDADVYHCNEVDSWFVGAALKVLRGKRCIFDVHEHYPSTFAESRFPQWLRPAVAGAIKLIFAILLPFTDRIVLAKRSVEDDFRCRAHKKVLVRNYTPIDKLQVSSNRSPRSSDSPMTIVHLGLIGKARGWPEVLAALSMTDNRVRLQVIGAFNDASEDEFHATVRELGLAERVELLEWMSFDAAFGYLSKAHVGLIAFQPHIQNHVYAMPHKLFDYMAAGLSVLMPKQAIEVAPIVEQTGCGLLVDPSNPDDLARGMNELFLDPARAHDMGEKGRAAVRKSYNWEAEAKSLVQMYKGFEKEQ